MTFWSGIVAAEKKLEKVDYYELLGVDKAASAGEIEERYYSLASRFHPDRFAASGNSAGLAALTRIYARVGEAKNILLDASARREYDRGLAVGVIRIREVSPKTRALSQQDPTNPMAQSLLAKATEAESAGELKSALANLQLALQFEASSSTLQLRLESVREKISEAEAVAEKMAAARRPKIAPQPVPAKAAVTPKSAPAQVTPTNRPVLAKIAVQKPAPAKLASANRPVLAKIAVIQKSVPVKVRAPNRPKATPILVPPKVAPSRNPIPASASAVPDTSEEGTLTFDEVTGELTLKRAEPVELVPDNEAELRYREKLQPVELSLEDEVKTLTLEKSVPSKVIQEEVREDEVGTLTLEKSVPSEVIQEEGTGALTIKRIEPVELGMDEGTDTPTPASVKPTPKKKPVPVAAVESKLDDDSWDFELPDAESDEPEPATLKPIKTELSDKSDLLQRESEVEREREPEVAALQPSASPFSLGELVGEYLRLCPLPAHSVLGIDEKASPAQARAAYEELVRLYHPHNNDAAGNPERMNVCRDLVGVVVKAYKDL